MSEPNSRTVEQDGVDTCIVDPDKGIFLVFEAMNRPLFWLVVSGFRRIDNGQRGEPFIVEYSKN